MHKRFLDFALALTGLILLSPVFVCTAIFIKLSSEGPVFYRGKRVGWHGLPFRIFKFRTMIFNADAAGATSTPCDDPRITRAGILLRKYKFDEIPQLLNILLGDMSFVGPRPQVEWDVANYTDEERLLLTVRPGITDYASIRFYNEGEILRGSTDPDKTYVEKIRPEKIRLGLEYVRNHSMMDDIKIILLTIFTILGIAGDSNETSANKD